MPTEENPAETRVASIVDLVRTLVRIPTRANADSCEPLFDVLEGWLRSAGVRVDAIAGPTGATVALACEAGSGHGPRYLLDATVDTAPFGDLSTWSLDPVGAEIVDGWLYGRGSGDCKAGVAIFAHLLADAVVEPPAGGTVVAVFDADEHTGGFAGIRAYMADDARRDRTAGVMIGYPGSDEIVVGSRGVVRAIVRVSGTIAPSGARDAAVANAIARAGRLVRSLDELGASVARGPVDDAFPLPPKITVTAVHGGEGFSVVPDACDVSFDVRVTPRYGCEWAQSVLRDAAAALDREVPAPRPTTIEFPVVWPAYRLLESSALPRALATGAERAFGTRPGFRVVGPSNIGNFLAGIGIEATAGFGVGARNLHAVDEAIDLATVAPVFATYRYALETLIDTTL